MINELFIAKVCSVHCSTGRLALGLPGCLGVCHHAQNTTLWCFRPYKPYIFWKLKVKGYLNWYSQVSHTQIHKHKYTKTQRHVYSIWQSARKTQHVLYFWKEACSRISKITFPCVKLTNTKIQIHKYTNTAYDKLPERPSMCYIFENRIVQGYQKSYSHVLSSPASHLASNENKYMPIWFVWIWYFW